MAKDESEREDDEKASTKDQPRFRPPIRKERGPEPPQRGLQSLEASKVERTKIKRPPARVIGWFVLVTAVALVFYFRYDSQESDRTRQKLLADQRAVESELGKLWYPLRDKVESWTVELATRPNDAPELIDAAALTGFSFQDLAGLYLRVPASEAGSAQAVREAVLKSSRDGFTACLMRTGGKEAPPSDKFCRFSSECKSGQICNEHGNCVEPGTPFNLSLGYRSLGVLSPDWVREVQNATSQLQLRALRGTFDDANRIDFPIAIRLLTQAKFFLVLVDERTEADEQAAKLAPVRVGLFRLADDKPLLMLRREATPSLQEPPGAVAAEATTRAALLRQAQSCELAQHVRCAVGDQGVACDGRK